MTTYAESGVNVEKGDNASRAAYAAAKATFIGRKNLIGEPIVLDDGFTGLLDFKDFYLVQNDDGVGTKAEVARQMRKYDTLGYDLVAMVADDAVCSGAEAITVSNTFDVDKVDHEEITALMDSLKRACLEQKIVIPGGEIAEMGKMVNGLIWNATCVGILEKSKFIEGTNIKVGDKIIGLNSRGFRANGLSLTRHILKTTFGPDWHKEKFDEIKTWGEAVLTPAIVYHDFVLSMIGRYKEKRKIQIKGIVHITGGGLGNNTNRVLKKSNVGAYLGTLPTPHLSMLKLQELGKVEDKEAYLTWNMGVGMVLVADKEEAEKILKHAAEKNFKAQIIGDVIEGSGVNLLSQGFFTKGKEIFFA